MKTIKPESINPTNYVRVENNEYMIFIKYTITDNFKGKEINIDKIEQRFCKASKNGNITISFAGNKIKTNLSKLQKGWI